MNWSAIEKSDGFYVHDDGKAFNAVPYQSELFARAVAETLNKISWQHRSDSPDFVILENDPPRVMATPAAPAPRPNKRAGRKKEKI
jgi:hypothetical protein